MYIIGDVHGCYKTLMALVNKLPKDAKLCFVGDLIDRGPQSADVIEFVKSNNHDCVLGNHEYMMADTDTENHGLWIMNGGDTTMKNYHQNIPLLKEHIEWIRTLPYIIDYQTTLPKLNDRHLLVSHSSAANYMAHNGSEDDIIWNRDVAHGTLKSTNNFYNVFGHTPTKEPLITNFCANIDTGAVYTDVKGYGKLTAIHWPSLKITQQENIEKDNYV